MGLRKLIFSSIEQLNIQNLISRIPLLSFMH